MKTLRPPTLLLLLLLAGCRGPDTIDVAPGAALRLCPPEAAPDFFLNQEVVITLPDGSRETLMAAMENRRGVLGLVAATPLGQTLFSMRVRDGKALVDVRAPLPGRFDPRMLPALVQFALWPEAAVRAGLGPGLRLEQVRRPARAPAAGPAGLVRHPHRRSPGHGGARPGPAPAHPHPGRLVTRRLFGGVRN